MPTITISDGQGNETVIEVSQYTLERTAIAINDFRKPFSAIWEGGSRDGTKTAKELKSLVEAITPELLNKPKKGVEK